MRMSKHYSSPREPLVERFPAQYRLEDLSHLFEALWLEGSRAWFCPGPKVLVEYGKHALHE